MLPLRSAAKLVSKVTLVLVLLKIAVVAQWTSLGPFGGDVRSVASDPAHPDRIFLGTSAGQLYVSNDSGTSWARLAHFGSDGDYVLDHIAIDPTNADTMYVAAWQLQGGGDLFRSEDGGKTWAAMAGVHGKSIRAMVLAPSRPSTVVVGALDGVFRSDDRGNTWERISPAGHAELKNIESIAVDPYHPDVIYAGTWHLPWKTSDGGHTWHSISRGVVEDSDVFSIIIDRDRPTVVYASACTGIYRSNNAGELFRKLPGIPYSARRTRALKQDPADSRTVYAGTTEGLWKTRDAGATWERLTAATVAVNDILIDPRHPEHVLLATDRTGVLASHDGGRTFAAANLGFAHRQITAVLVDRRDPGTIYVAVINNRDFGGVFVSRDAGMRWAQLNEGLAGREVFSLDQGSDGGLVAGTNTGVYVLRGEDRWRWTGEAVKQAPTRLRRTHLNAGSVQLTDRVAQVEVLAGKWLAATARGLFVSMDEGRRWRVAAGPHEPDLIAVGGRGALVAAASPRALLVSRDGGATFIRNALPLYVTRITGVAVTPESTLWVTTTQGAFTSTDGATWEHVIVGVPARNLAAIAYDAERSRLLGASATSGEIFESYDGGRSWTLAANAGVPVRRLLINGGRLLAATEFDGLVVQVEPATGPARKVDGPEKQ